MNNLANLLPCCGDKDVSKYKEAIVDPLLKKAPEKT
jgi:hypothetical protein